MRGDEGFEAFVRDIRPAAERVAARYLRFGGVAEDAVWEGLASVFLDWDALRDHPGLPGIALYRVRNAAIARWRREARQERIRVRVGRAPAAAGSGADASFGGDSRLDGVEAAVLSLRGRQRDVAVARFLDGLTEQETAAALGISVGAVKQHGSRARAALRRALVTPEGLDGAFA